MTSLARARAPVVIALAVGIALGALLPAALGKTGAAPTAIRNALAQTDRVQGAPGRTMVLSRVVVEPGAKLATHHHLGTQIARVQSGVLRYTVREGSAMVRRGEPDQNATLVRKIEAGQTAAIRSGQWIVEQPSDIHEAANRGTAPVVLYLATLLEDGAAPSTPVSLPPRD
jgi:mannose-6-phosphate isomerase-like protein (cupin superfamily)